MPDLENQALRKHFWDYLILVLILVVGFFVFFLFNYNRLIQIEIVILVSIFYVFWGIAHHFFDRNLSLKIILDYFLIAALSSIALIFLLLRT